MTKLSSSILVLNLIQLWSCLFVDFYTVRVKPNPNRTTVPRGITHFLSSTCLCLYPPNSKYLSLSLFYNTIYHHILISLSLSSSIQFPTRRHNDAVLRRRNSNIFHIHLLIRRRTRRCSPQQ